MYNILELLDMKTWLFILIVFSLLYPFLFKFLVLKFLKRYGFEIQFSGIGFVTPFYFVSKNVYIQFDYKEDYDFFQLSCKKLKFLINPLYFLKKQLIIEFVRMEYPNLYYENKYNSYRKIKLLPEMNQVIIKNFLIKGGSIETIDFMLPGPYRFNLTEINCLIRKIDLSIPVSLLFFVEQGNAKIDSGDLQIQLNKTVFKPTGSLYLKNIKWTTMLGLSLPFVDTSFSLFVYFTHESDREMIVSGYLHVLGTKEDEHKEGIEKEGMPFVFRVEWEKFRLPIDLGLQKFVEKIFETIHPNLLERSLVYLGREVFDRIKKQPE